MYYLTKTFEVPMAHRLSKHKGRCFLLHGHNLLLEVTIKSNELDDNDMVMDFSKLKELVNEIISSWDHGLFINETDKECLSEVINSDVHVFDCDPTSEVLCKFLFKALWSKIQKMNSHIFIESISIQETKNSKSTYKE